MRKITPAKNYVRNGKHMRYPVLLPKLNPNVITMDALKSKFEGAKWLGEVSIKRAVSGVWWTFYGEGGGVISSFYITPNAVFSPTKADMAQLENRCMMVYQIISKLDGVWVLD